MCAIQYILSITCLNSCCKECWNDRKMECHTDYSICCLGTAEITGSNAQQQDRSWLTGWSSLNDRTVIQESLPL